MREYPDLCDLNIDDFSVDVEDYDALAVELAKLADYATMKASAMIARKSGAIHVAEHYEASMQSLYNSLPSNWRW